MKLLILCCSLAVIQSCFNDQFQRQQETAGNFIKLFMIEIH